MDEVTATNATPIDSGVALHDWIAGTQRLSDETAARLQQLFRSGRIYPGGGPGMRPVRSGDGWRAVVEDCGRESHTTDEYATKEEAYAAAAKWVRLARERWEMSEQERRERVEAMCPMPVAFDRLSPPNGECPCAGNTRPS